MASEMGNSTLDAILYGPALKAPVGHTSNFDSHETLGQALATVNILFTLVAIIVVTLRLYTRAFIIKDVGADDWTLLAGVCTYVVYSACILVMVGAGAGHHQWNLRMIEMSRILYYLRLLAIFYGPAVALTKTSICLQYIKIFCTNGKRDRMFWSCWAVIVCLILYFAAHTLVEIFICSPIEKDWQPWRHDGKCVDSAAVFISSASFNVLSDAALLTLPLRSVWQLHMPLRRKIKISAAFALGIFATVASIIRLRFNVQIYLSPDKTWNTCLMLFWTYAEFIAIFVCSCAPALGHLAKHWRQRLFKNKQARSQQEDVSRYSLQSTTSHVSKASTQVEFVENIALGPMSSSKGLIAEIEPVRKVIDSDHL